MVGAMFSRGSRQKVARPPLTDEQLLAAAVSALASRSRSEAELRRLLQKKLTEPGGPRIDKVVARLHELGYFAAHPEATLGPPDDTDAASSGSKLEAIQ